MESPNFRCILFTEKLANDIIVMRSAVPIRLVSFEFTELSVRLALDHAHDLDHLVDCTCLLVSIYLQHLPQTFSKGI